MNNHTYIGVDLGTSSLKLVLIDSRNELIAQSTQSYTTTQPKDGWNEIDPSIWYDALINGMKDLLVGQDATNVRCIGVTGQMHTLVLLDKDSNSIRPAIMWNDTRTKAILPKLREQLSSFSDGEYLSKTVSTGSPLAGLAWMKENEPLNFERISKFLIGPDYIVHRLTGNITTDYCEASTSCMYQLNDRKWSDEVRQLLGLKETNYPLLMGSAQSAGKLIDPNLLSRGISPETEIIVGTGDNPATAVSTGCLAYQYPVISLGTSGVLMTSAETNVLSKVGKRILFSVDDNNISTLVQGAVQANGNTLSWFCNTILGTDDYSKVDSLLVERIEDSITKALVPTDVLFYPHLNGDKTLYSDPELRGAFLGLSLKTSKTEMLQAVLEGLSFAFRQLAEIMEVLDQRLDAIRVVGGGAKSCVWMQILSDVMNKKIIQMGGLIGPGYGSVLLARYYYENKTGYNSSLKELTIQSVREEQTYIPNPKCVSAYNVKYKKYKKLYKLMKSLS